MSAQTIRIEIAARKQFAAKQSSATIRLMERKRIAELERLLREVA